MPETDAERKSGPGGPTSMPPGMVSQPPPAAGSDAATTGGSYGAAPPPHASAPPRTSEATAAAAASSGSQGAHANHDATGSHLTMANISARSFKQSVLRAAAAQSAAPPPKPPAETLWHKLRERAYHVVRHRWFDRLVMAAILLNSVCLAFEDPLDTAGTAPMSQFLDVSDMVFQILFTVEMLIKMLGLGLWNKEHGGYMRDWWNVLDGVLVCGWWAFYRPGEEDSNFAVVRVVRVLRPLRAINNMRGLKMLIDMMMTSLPQLLNVMGLCAFIFAIFGIVGVQLFNGRLNQRCYLPPDVAGANRSAFVLAENGGHRCTLDTSGGDVGRGCPLVGDVQTVCRAGGSHLAPNNGITSFDNMLFAFLTIFQCITLEGWVDVMYWTEDTMSSASAVYYILLIAFGSLFLLNLIIAVIALNLSLERVAKEKHAKAENWRVMAQSALLEEGETSMRAAMSRLIADRYEQDAADALAIRDAADMPGDVRQQREELVRSRELAASSRLGSQLAMAPGKVGVGGGPAATHRRGVSGDTQAHADDPSAAGGGYGGYGGYGGGADALHMGGAAGAAGVTHMATARPAVHTYSSQASAISTPRVTEDHGEGPPGPGPAPLRVSMPISGDIVDSLVLPGSATSLDLDAYSGGDGGGGGGEVDAKSGDMAAAAAAAALRRAGRHSSDSTSADKHEPKGAAAALFNSPGVGPIATAAQQSSPASGRPPLGSAGALTATLGSARSNAAVAGGFRSQGGLAGTGLSNDTAASTGPHGAGASSSASHSLNHGSDAGQSFGGLPKAMVVTASSRRVPRASEMSRIQGAKRSVQDVSGYLDRGQVNAAMHSLSLAWDQLAELPGVDAEMRGTIQEAVARDRAMSNTDGGDSDDAFAGVEDDIFRKYRPDAGAPWWRPLAFAVIKRPAFQIVIISLIVTNTLILALEHHDQPVAFGDVLSISNIVLTFLFALEMALKIAGLTLEGYVSDGFNVFDGVIVIISLLDLAMSDSSDNIGVSAMRIFRLLRIFKLARSWTSLNVFLNTMVGALPRLGPFSVVLLLFMYIYSLLGLQLFGGKLGSLEAGDLPRAHYDTLLWSFTTTFQVLTGENWNEVMYTTVDGVGWGSVFYFVSLVVVGNFIVLNVFLAILIDNFSSDDDDEEGGEGGGAGADAKADAIESILSLHVNSPALKKRDLVDSDDEGDGGDGGGGVGDIVVSSVPSSQQRAVKVAPAPGSAAKTVANRLIAGGAFDVATASEARGASDSVHGPDSPSSTRPAVGMPVTADSDAGNARSPTVTAGGGGHGSSRVATGLSTPARKDSNGAASDSASDAAASVRDRKMSFRSASWASGRLNVKAAAANGINAEAALSTTAAELRNFRARAPEEVTEEELKRIDDHRDVFLAAKRALESDFHRHDSYGHKAFFLLPGGTPLRLALGQLVLHPLFDMFVLMLITVSCVLLALESKGNSPALTELLDDTSLVVTILFITEMGLKWIAFGLLGHPGAYLRNYWNVLDFVIVTTSILDLALDSELKILRSMRLFRALRPLRMVRRLEGLRVVVNSILKALPNCVHVFMVSTLSLLIFGILGVSFFGGKLKSCTDPTRRCEPRLAPDCPAPLACNGTWVNPSSGLTEARQWLDPSYSETGTRFSFDHVGVAIVTLFEVSSLELWLDVMYACADITRLGWAPERDANQYAVFFFFLVVVVCSFFMLNLFVTVVVDNFGKIKREMQLSSAFMTESQQQWASVQRVVAKMKPGTKYSLSIDAPAWRQRTFQVVTKPAFEGAIMALIMLNIVVMALHHYDMSAEWEDAFFIANAVFGAIFILEACLKLAGLGFKTYFSSKWNVFDFALVVINIATFTYSRTAAAAAAGTVAVDFKLLRVIRIGRIFRLIKTSTRLRAIFFTLLLSLPSLANVGALMLLLFFVFAVAGVNLFEEVPLQDFVNEHANFQTFWRAMITLFRMSTGESWNGIMHECARATSEAAVVAYFGAFMIIGQFMMLNLFVAVILENFESEMAQDSESATVRKSDLDLFADVWERVCNEPRWRKARAAIVGAVKQRQPELDLEPDDNQWLPKEATRDILLQLPPPLGLPALLRVSEPIVTHVIRRLVLQSKHGLVHYKDTVRGFALRVAKGEDSVKYLAAMAGVVRRASAANAAPLLTAVHAGDDHDDEHDGGGGDGDGDGGGGGEPRHDAGVTATR